jgi:signal transduction histidine kinase
MGEGPVRVLLIEDDEDDYLLTRDLFAALPAGVYHLDRVADFDSALQALDECQHDLYLIDYRLGAHTGLELIAEALARGCTAPLIMLTGQQEREVDLLAMQAGAVDFLVKDGLTAGVLERSMRYALRNKRLEEEIRRANQLLEKRVQHRTAELERLNAVLQAEVTERMRAEAALRENDRRKDQFLATLAHELRNPLSPLTASCQLIGLDPENFPQVRELVVIMSRQLDHLHRLIGDLLDVSRISSNKLTLRREPLAIGEAIAAALDVARPLIEAAQHTLEVRLAPELQIVAGDRVRLAQAIGNLLVNAAKYTPPGGRIQLEQWAEAGVAVIRIRDSGIGIPPDKLGDIFGLFNQVDSSHTRSQGGLGIGLTLAKTLVEMHGGSIAAASGGVNLGSEFTIRIPLADVELPRAPPAGAEPVDGAALPSFRLLVVDDNASASHLLARVLQKLGQQVQVAGSAAAALAALQDMAADAVISDIAMPDVSGYELATRIRNLPLPKQPFLVALTGYGQDSDRRDALAAGFDLHLTKPIGLPELRSLIEKLRRR